MSTLARILVGYKYEAISTNPKHTIYRNFYEDTGPGGRTEPAMHRPTITSSPPGRTKVTGFVCSQGSWYEKVYFTIQIFCVYCDVGYLCANIRVRGKRAGYPFNRQIIQFEFSPTSSCVSLTRSTTSSEWKLFRFDKMEVNSFQILLVDVTFYLYIFEMY